MTENCIVKFNCRHRWDCSFCDNYSDYQAYDRRLLSPAQLERRNQRAEDRKNLKQTEKSKQGKRNKYNSYKSEKSIVKKYQKWGFEAERVPLSGALKGSLSGDVKVYINGKWRIHEDKKRSNVESLYERTDNQTIMYENFCIMMSEDTFQGLLLGIVPDVTPMEDKKTKTLHKFFDQDNADIVSIRQHGRQKSVYAITLDFWEELKGVAKCNSNK